MKNLLKLHKYIDGIHDTPFPNNESQVEIVSFRYDAKRMGGAPSITCTVVHHMCLDKIWTDNVYATFNNERFFIKQIPTSSYDNADSRYKHDVELVSERVILDNVYFYDVVYDDVTNDKPVSNSSKFVFFGDVHEFARRLNYSLQYSKIGYNVVVDSGITSDAKMISFENQFFSNVLQEIYNTYEIPYYFSGKTIHIGYTNNTLPYTFKYGVQESLLSIQKQNAGYKVVNRVTGVGSSDNIPYYYPNEYESKEEVESHGGTWVNPQSNLMPPIYRESFGKDRFYSALNNEYIIPDTNEYYYFNNPYVDGKPREHIVNFGEIKPTIVGTVNASGYRIDMFSEFAYDDDDNDDIYPEDHEKAGEYKHPYFFGKLRKFDGEFGFNLFEHSIDENEMVISMTDGSCGSCEWIIGVDEDTQKNIVQVDENGDLKRDEEGNVVRQGAPQDRQNDTRNYEVWIALKKDINTFGVIMPNASNNYRPSAGDTFVILHIDLPKSYILDAENRLKESLIRYMSMNNDEKFNFSIAFSRIFFAEHPEVLEQLNENARIYLEYDSTIYELFISSYSYSITNDKPLPEIKVELSDTLTISQNALQTAISEVKKDILSGIGGMGGVGSTQGGGNFLRKDMPDNTPFTLGVGGLVFQSKPINKFIRYYDGELPETTTDADIYSALAVDKRIEQGYKVLDDRYLRKDKEDTAQKHIEFQEGITVHQLAEMENIDVEVLARIAKAFVTQIGSEKFVDGFFGEGYQIWKAIATGDWNFTIDRLTVRKVMTVYELIVQKIRSVGGMVVVSAGNGKVKEVEQVGLEYKFTFEDENTFQVHDLMRCQVWTGSGVKYYWVEVVRVEDGAVYTRVADFAGVEPSAGDEVVLMGNTQNPLRQGLVLISAAEDGQPRVDVLDGVNTTNFDDCLKARLGGLDGITDSRFPADMQPQGYGLYANNCYLTGVFVLSNGKDVQTQFAIMEGMIRANMSSIQQQINAEDNYLSNASMTTNLTGWEFNNDVKVFRTSGGLLHFNGNFYSIKNAIAGIVPNGEKTVLRLKNSFIRQKNASFSMHPTFDLVEQMTTDADGKEVGTGVMLYRPRMFYVSFRYMVTKRGTLKVCFENEQKRNDFEEYEPLNYTKVLEVGNSFMVTDDFLSGKWNGTGDFYLSFDGDMYLYDLALSDDPLSDMEERWSMQLEITEKKIQANAEHIVQQGQNLEEYRSEFLYTAEQLRTEFTSLVQNEKEDITEAYTGLVTQTAQSLTSEYNAKIGNYYGKVTEEYSSKITQTAKDITTTLNAKIDATDKAVGDLEVGLKADYNAKISASATSLQSDYNSKITNLRTGDIATMKSSIEQQAGQIALKASQSSVDALTGRVTNAEARFDLYVLETELGNLVSKIEISADQVNLSGAITYQMFSPTLAEKFETKADGDDLYALEQELNNSVAALNRTISSLQTDVDGKASTTSLNNKVNELNTALNTKADSDLTNAVLGGSTLVVGGYINTDVIDVDKLVVKKLKAVKDGYTYTLDANGFVISDSDGDRLTELCVYNNFGYFMMKHGDNYFTMDGNSLMFASNVSQNGVTSLSRKGLNLESYSSIQSLRVGNIANYYNSHGANSDFIVMKGAVTLAGASESNKGKVIFIKCSSRYTLTVPACVNSNGSSSTSSDKGEKTYRDNLMRMFISDGSTWYESNLSS